MKQINLGLIGLGYIGNTHLRHGMQLGDAKIVGVADVSKASLSKAKKMGVKRIQAQVRVSNHIGIGFYQKHGYEIEGVKKSAVLINGNYENEFYLSKILE